MLSRHALSHDRPSRPASAGRAVLALAIMLMLAVGRMASANVVPMSLEEMVAVSDIIVTARVAETKPGMVGRHVVTTARFDVIESLKGKTAAGPLELTYLGGNYEIIHVDVPQVPTFKQNEEVTLFLSQPAKRLPKSAQKSLNMSSPLVASYQVVGGKLGRFDLTGADGEQNKSRKGSEPIPSDLVVSRRFSVRQASGSTKQTTVNPTYSAFKGAILDLVAKETAKKNAKGTPDKITGVIGTFAVPEKSADPIVRMFDPLPSIAYMSKDEVDAINEEVRQSQKANSKEGAEK
ncbi:hypothetical protein GC173_00635 [bacterium]|nr:hypothetical protein [bacterium]